MNDIILSAGLAVDYNQVSKEAESLRQGMTHSDSVDYNRGSSNSNLRKKRIAYYEELLEKISNVTNLDPGPEYEHSFCNDYYQNEVKVITERYKEENPNPTAIVSVNLMDYATV
ncbi:unnamed protein product [Candidatus Protochlamydia amoebophila UWE25]|uniref:Uncharacterized protein n=3 Tax=Candidatus Protochlamydia amoebophila TaxID=362787 RepID=A0A2P9H9H6_PARUW|nr:hypothetical protein [Candidatus Protochlamydia amoebophila]KIC73451.1 hypothetical protein DB44_BG01410 [Candidatus Protochlamydia amoebophila]SPJ31644.1 unnamed protein product [Candidatus Protochlamydia amoebophila UWE25]